MYLQQTESSRKVWNTCLLCCRKVCRSWSLRWVSSSFIAMVFLDLIPLKQVLGKVPQRTSRDSPHASVLRSPGTVVSKHQLSPWVCVWPRRWHWKMKELKYSPFHPLLHYGLKWIVQMGSSEVLFCCVKPDCPVLHEGLGLEGSGEPCTAHRQALGHVQLLGKSSPLGECCACFPCLEMDQEKPLCWVKFYFLVKLVFNRKLMFYHNYRFH